MAGTSELRIVDCNVKEIDNDLLVIEWILNQRPQPEWLTFLKQSDVPKASSIGYAELVGTKLRMHVEDRDIEAATDYLKRSIIIANYRFESEVLAKCQRESAERQQDAAIEARLQDARARLRNAIDSSDG